MEMGVEKGTFPSSLLSGFRLDVSLFFLMVF